jgi:putative nucleotidyltransferase with HDIG domain
LSGTLHPSIEEQRLVEAANERRFSPLDARERRAEAVLGVSFVLACVLLAVASPPAWDAVAIGTAVACATALGIAGQVRFVVGAGFTVPTQLAFVPLAFNVPPALLAPAVAAVLVTGGLLQVARGRVPVSRLAVIPSNAWFALGPGIVMAVAGAPSAAEASAGLLCGMLAAQVAVDFGATAVREMLHGSFSWRQLAGEAWIYGVDAALTPVAFLAATTLEDRPWTVFATVPLIAVLAVFARERQGRMEGLGELNAAHRGIALVLGDVVEADDGYTGEHCRDVVELATAVGRELGLPADRMRNLEFGALLHDVGKVAIPKEIINKPGPLDDEERTIVNTHTIEGQRMLNRVGGFMREVGVIVRAHHERWDGNGYPDGLAGAAIPLEARIVAACDTWNAMTSDRCYRAALPLDVAEAEVRAVSGSQLDPDVVAAMLSVTIGSAERSAPEEPAALRATAA